jgi:hypothetical protein
MTSVNPTYRKVITSLNPDDVGAGALGTRKPRPSAPAVEEPIDLTAEARGILYISS